MVIKRGILQSFNPANYTASVLLLEATSYTLSNVPVANHIDGTSAVVGALCALLFFDEHNAQDAVMIAVFAGGSSGFPTPPPGRITMVAGYQQALNVSIANNVVQTINVIGGGIPSGALAVLFKAYFYSSSVGAYIQLAPHGASDITACASIGNLAVANSYLNGTGIVAVDASGNIDIRANAGTCVVTLYTYGYVM
jgi:hypothetical protein